MKARGEAMDTVALLGENLRLVNSQKIAYFSTVNGEGIPQVRAVFNLRCRDAFPGTDALFDGHDRDFQLYFTTSTSSVKMEEIRRQPAVSVYYCRPDDFHGLMLTGRIEVVEDPAVKSALWQEGWERYYPQGREDPDYSILCLRPSRMKGWHRGERFTLDLPAAS
jgi:general stress protein 26